MDKNQLLIKTARELAIRLSNAEIDRADFKVQAEQYLNENQELKKQVQELQKQLNNQKDNNEKKDSSKK